MKGSGIRTHERRTGRRGPLSLLVALAGAALVLAAASSAGLGMAAAGGSVGAIAYVRADTGDEIRLVDPDGNNDRLLWTHGLPDPEDVFSVWSMAWRPGGAELAFVSTHELGCSLNHSDIYVVGADGSGYRRITQAPACAALAGYPQGTVNVPVRNDSFDTADFFLYFQGAPGVQQVSLPPGGSTVVTFNNVADLGVVQTAMAIEGFNRQVTASAASVQPGGSVTTPEFSYTGLLVPGWETRSPTWRHDGSQIGFARGFNILSRLPLDPAPLQLGDDLVPGSEAANMVLYAAWAPTAALANHVLYQGYYAFESDGIYLATEGSTEAGDPLILIPFDGTADAIRGLAWLPDGSGFVFSVTEDFFSRGNIFEYTFDGDDVQRLTDYADQFTGQVSVSPDGSQIAFEVMPVDPLEDSSESVVVVMSRDGTGEPVLLNNARAPAWMPGAAPEAPDMPYRLFLPLLLR